MRKIGFGLYGLALALVCLFVPGSARAQAPPSSIQVFMPNGGMPGRALLMTMVSDSGRTDVVITDSKGVFSIKTPTTGNVSYTVTIKGDGQTFETITSRFRLERNSPGRFFIFLKPLTATKPLANGVLDVSTFEGNIPSRARAAYKQGMELIGNHQFEKAIDSLQQAITIYPDYVRARNDLGVVLMKLNRLDQAADTFRNALKIDKRFFHARMNLGIVLTQQGKYREALDVLEPLYDENHGMIEVRLAYARALEGAGQLPDAVKVYRSTLESKNLAPSNQADMHFCLGVIFNRQGKFADAADELRRAIAIDDSPNSHLQLGAALMFSRELDEAESELLRAYELGGRSVGAAQLLLGNIYYVQQKFAQAQRAFEKYLTDVPTASNAPQIAKIIADLRTRSKN